MFTRRRKDWTGLFAAVLASLMVTAAARAVPAFMCTFNGPDTVWHVLDNGVRSEVLAHDCQPGGARDNGGFERVVVAAAAGQSVLLGCSTPPVAVLDELQVRLWVKSARPDIQLAARIKLPRSVDPKGHAMATTIVKGTAHTRPGHWQELIVTNVPKLLAAQVRVMRTTPGAEVDPREAYLDSVVLLLPGDPKGIEVETDQCEVEGVIVTPASENTPAASARDSTLPPSRNAASQPASFITQTGFEGERTTTKSDSPVRLQGTTLMVEGKPFLPRAIEWNGEPLKFLADRGFNVVQSKSPPSPQQIADAERYDLWFICTPPRPEAIARDGLGMAGDRVLAWYLDDEALEADPNYALRWTELIRERDAVYGRPILVSSLVNGSAVSNSADVLIARHPRNCLLTGTEYEESLRSCAQLGRPGTPLWAGINTQFGDAVRDQINSLLHNTDHAPAADAEHLESLVRVACTSGIRGFVFQSNSPLSEIDAATRARAAVVELLNRRLQLMEAWLAGGKVVSNVTSTDGAVTAAVMYVDRARLLVPVSKQPAEQIGMSGTTPATNELTFIVPGVSESSQVYFLTPISLRQLSSERIAGGTKIVVPSADGFVVITEDLKVIHGLRQYVTRHGAPTLRVERDLAVERAKAIFQTDQRLAPPGFPSKLSPNDASAINARLAKLDAAMRAGQLEPAHLLVSEVLAELHRTAAEQHRKFTPPDRLQSNALTLTADRTADFAALEKSFVGLHAGENLLPAGDFENLSEMTQVGWQHIVHASAGASTHAELSADEPRNGRYCLELQAAAESSTPVTMPVDPLVWIVSPPMPVDANKIVEVTGWVRIDQAFGKRGSGLAIMDTVGGPELSLIVGQTSDWQSFRMIRAVPKAAELRLTFALTGIGSAKVDGVMVRTLEQPIARRLPSVTRPASSHSSATAEAPAPISRLPKTR